MDGVDYPLEHFQLMAEVARYLRSLETQMLEATYAFSSFGSWSFVFQIKGENFRIVWDGRDAELLLEADRGYKAPFSYEWTELLKLEEKSLTGDALLQGIQVLIEKARLVQNVAEGDDRK